MGSNVTFMSSEFSPRTHYCSPEKNVRQVDYKGARYLPPCWWHVIVTLVYNHWYIVIYRWIQHRYGQHVKTNENTPTHVVKSHGVDWQWYARKRIYDSDIGRGCGQTGCLQTENERRGTNTTTCVMCDVFIARAETRREPHCTLRVADGTRTEQCQFDFSRWDDRAHTRARAHINNDGTTRDRSVPLSSAMSRAHRCKRDKPLLARRVARGCSYCRARPKVQNH